MRKLMMLAAMLAMMLAVAAPAVAQVGQGVAERDTAGNVDTTFTANSTGNNANQCTPLLQGAQTGAQQNAQGITQYGSGSGDIGAGGGTFTIGPELSSECTPTVQQSAAASSKAAPPEAAPPKAAPPPSSAPPKGAPPPIEAKGAPPPSPAPPPVEAKTAPPPPKEEMKQEGEKELPETGGTGSASLLGLGAGALLIGGGLLARRIVR